MNYTIKQNEKELFDKWSLECPNGGLLFRGDFGINTKPNDNGDFTWNRTSANEEELWYNSCKRLMILTKDLNDNELWDIREESGGRKHLKKNHILSMKDLQFHGKIFHRRLNRWVFGIYEEYNGKYPSFEEVQDYKEMGLYYEKVPLVRINCKIEIGGSCVENNVLVESMHKNKTFLIEQIKLYKANIILCCGSAIFYFLKKNYFDDMIEVDDSEDWIYYSKTKNIVIINSYHPSYRGRCDKWLYDELMKKFSQSVSKLKMKFLPLTE